MVTSRDGEDEAMMARCVALSRIAVGKGEYPFGAVVAREGRIVAEAINRTIRDGDVSRHAEVIALARAQKAIGRRELRECSLYSNVEPCAMCSYCIREAWVGRVVYALGSPVMGGVSKWNILRDDGLSGRMPQVFDAAPEVVSGVLVEQAQAAWRDWSPLAWEMITLRGLMTDPSARPECRTRAARPRSLWHHLVALIERPPRPYVDPTSAAEGHADL
ncbi:nucleoside deaminase [Rhodoplanes roseus]|uniref:CMP/dCMP-type deaminase domain-containing protein n=1 Tax=Rhodoplanes roseus TaxID=29409 RepID=A0A327L2Q5_9BRAD|nr:nucleoside deaminase [Rhodoplanes roseus]RAI45380.1 hypothetical protein CH341_04280 [Rhodoplanes roseus]